MKLSAELREIDLELASGSGNPRAFKKPSNRNRVSLPPRGRLTRAEKYKSIRFSLLPTPKDFLYTSELLDHLRDGVKHPIDVSVRHQKT